MKQFSTFTVTFVVVLGRAVESHAGQGTAKMLGHLPTQCNKPKIRLKLIHNA